MLESLQQSAFSQWMIESTSIWAYPTILTLHTLGMMVLAGAAMVIDLRLLGIGRVGALGYVIDTTEERVEPSGIKHEFAAAGVVPRGVPYCRLGPTSLCQEVYVMRMTTFVVAFILSLSGVAAAQEMADFVSVSDGFKVTLPGQPTVTNATWTSEHGYPMPAHVYTLNRGNERYKITVADYRPIEQEGIKRAEGCNPPANICTGNANTGQGFWKHDVRGATIFGAMSLIKRDGTRVSDMVWAQHNRIEGIELQLVNTDGSRTYGYVAMHNMMLYVTEATMPRTSPPATLFQTSMEFVDGTGATVAYQFVYSNTFHGMGIYPPPPRGGVPPNGWERPVAARAAGPAPAPTIGGRGGNTP